MSMDKKFYTVKELSEILPIGTSNLYNLVNSKNFPSIKINRRILISIDEFQKWIETSAGKQIIL